MRPVQVPSRLPSSIVQCDRYLIAQARAGAAGPVSDATDQFLHAGLLTLSTQSLGAAVAIVGMAGGSARCP